MREENIPARQKWRGGTKAVVSGWACGILKQGAIQKHARCSDKLGKKVCCWGAEQGGRGKRYFRACRPGKRVKARKQHAFLLYGNVDRQR